MREIKLNAFDGKELHVNIWDDVKDPLGVFQLVHGSAEHSLRYDEFAQFLNKNGYIVVANDHRGHGKTANLEENELGFFAEENGWITIIDDLYKITSYIKETYNNLPICIFGHSMGSFMVRTYLSIYGNDVQSAIISGTNQMSKFLATAMKKVAIKRQRRIGPKGADEFIWKLSYQSLNKKFKHEGKTGSEWQTQDTGIQKEFEKDPLCGQHFSPSAFKDLAVGMLYMVKTKNIKKIPKNLPILVVAGEDDAVGMYGKGPTKFYNKLKKTGHKRIKLMLYPNMRHELLFEVNKETVEKHTLNFLNKTLKK